MSKNLKNPEVLMTKALQEIKKLKAQLAEAQDKTHEPVAVVGMSCRLPGGADHPEAFWQGLVRGMDAVTPVPADRWDANLWYDPDPNTPGKAYTDRGAFLAGDVYAFEPAFFGISAREAEETDPQQRLLLECTWHALEDAGIRPSQLRRGRTGVFIGLAADDYTHFNNFSGNPDTVTPYSATGTSRGVAAGRIAYLLGLRGPTLQVDTTCSSSLTACHLACSSLRLGECEQAIVGGVHLNLSPLSSVYRSKLQALAPDGRCKTFDADANGFGQGEGCAVLCLMRLSRARAQGRQVLAIIKGSGVNHNGPGNGLTAPNQTAQEELIRATLASANLTPETVSYVEAHGTGTALGDPIEVNALNTVFGQRNPATPLLIGSLKSNIGHLEAAAGIASMVKTILALRHRELPASLHVRQPNPLIEWDHMPIEVVTEHRTWPAAAQGPLRAGVSSFGINGTNAFLILEEGDKTSTKGEPTPSEPPPTDLLLTLSARGPTALQALAGRHAEMLAQGADAAAHCRAAHTERDKFPHRIAVRGGNGAELANALQRFIAGESDRRLWTGVVATRRKPRIAFLISGQGAQFAGMGCELYAQHPVFRDTVDQVAELFRAQLADGTDIRTIMFDHKSKAIHQTQYTQPALFTLAYGLARVWHVHGVQPDALFGHSVGEYVAAVLAEVFSLEDAVRLLAERARLLQSTDSSGTMIAVRAPVATVAAHLAGLEDRADIAADNGPNTVVSGTADAVALIETRLLNVGIQVRRLSVSHAFHSPLTEPILQPFAACAAATTFQRPTLPLYTNRTGGRAPESIAGANYWVRQIRERVRFREALESLIADGYDLLIELGPQPQLLGMTRHLAPAAPLLMLPSLKKGTGDVATFHEALAQLFIAGLDLDGAGRHPAPTSVRLPLYPFDRQVFRKTRASTTTPNLQPSTCLQEKRSATMTPTTPVPKNQVLQSLINHFVTSLKTPAERIDTTAMLTALGADSFVLADLVRLIDERYGIHISIRRLFEEENTLEKLAEAVVQGAERGLEPGAPPYRPTSTPARQSNVDPRTALTREVTTVVATAVNQSPERIDTAATLLALGADSFVLADIIRRLETAYHLKFSIRQLFEELSSIDAVVAYLMERGATPTSAPTTATPPMPAHSPAPKPPQAQPPIASEGLGEVFRHLRSVFDALETLTVGTTAPMTPGLPAAIQPTTPPPAPPKTSPQPTTQASAAWNPPESETPAPLKLTDRQRKYLASFTAAYCAKTNASKRLAEQSRGVLCNNRKSSSGFRMESKNLFYPILAERAQGGRFTDPDGNEYVDIAMGFGCHFFGHGPDFINEAVRRRLEKGAPIGPDTAIAPEIGRLLKELTGMDRVAFCNSGTEAVMTAIRIARAATGRPKVAVFNGAYHGHADATLVMPSPGAHKERAMPMVAGIPRDAVADVLVLPFQDEKAFDIIADHGDELAAVIVEPVQNRRPDVHDGPFLKKLRELTQRRNIILIFDEILVGFRIAPGGAQSWFGIKADMATYGKVVGGGYPLGLVTGRREIMDLVDGGVWRYDDQSHPQSGTTYTAGTFCRHPLAMAATLCVLQRFQQEGARLHNDLNCKTEALAKDLNALFQRHQVPLRMVHFGSFFRFAASGNLSFVYQPFELDLFFYHLIQNGVYVWEGRTCFLSTAHTPADLAQIRTAVERALQQMKLGGFWPDAHLVLNRVQPHSAPTPIEAPAPAAPTAHLTARVTPSHPAPDSATKQSHRGNAPKFSLYYFGNYQAAYQDDKYQLLMNSARFGDRNGFHALWLPERHFHSFGGFSPNPSVLAAALARDTEQIRIHSGSVALPLHHPIRVAEEWSVVDNLSQGRTGLSFASGWHPDDFVFAPEVFENRREFMFEQIEIVRRLWRGESVTFPTPNGKTADLRIYPQPMQTEVPIWLTMVGNPQMFEKAGEMGAGILTNLGRQGISELKKRLDLYYAALEKHGHGREKASVVVLLHTLVGDTKQVRRIARDPFFAYMEASAGRIQDMVDSLGLQGDLSSLSPEDRDYLLSAAFKRYVEQNALIGAPDDCLPIIRALQDAGVTEIGCFIDFGVDTPTVLRHLDDLNQLKQRVEAAGTPQPTSSPANITAPALQQPTTKPPRREPTTRTQKLVWLLAQMGSAPSTAYNLPMTLELEGELKPAALETALAKLVERHESLRTTFSEDGETQLIHADLARCLGRLDLSGANATQRETRLAEFYETEAVTAFDLANEPPIRATLIQLEPDRHLLALCCHHIVVDGWSMGVLLEELAAHYREAAGGAAANLPAVPAFAEYVQATTNYQTTAAWQADKAYWQGEIGENPPPTQLPTDWPHPSTRTYRGARRNLHFDHAFLSRLKALGARAGCTPFITFLGAFKAFMHRFTDQEDLIIGAPASGRGDQPVGVDHMIGFCANVLPIRGTVGPETHFFGLLQDLKKRFLLGFEHQMYPFSQMLENLPLDWDARHTALVSVIFNWDRVSVPAFHDLRTRFRPQPIRHVRFDFSFSCTEDADGLHVDLDYSTEIFNEDSIDQWCRMFQTFLAELSTQPQAPLLSLPLFSEAERAQARQKVTSLVTGRPLTPFPRTDIESTIHQRLARIAGRHPNRRAVVTDTHTWTYAELSDHMQKTARAIAAVKRGGRVALYFEHGAHMIAAMPAVLAAGNAYVPLDPFYPRERLRHILSDAAIDLVLTNTRNLAEARALVEDRFPVLNMEALPEAAAKTLPDVTPDALAYLLYTSGTTGAPKGIMQNHRNVLHFIATYVENLRIDVHDRISLLPCYGFDSAVMDIYAALLTGAELHPFDIRGQDLGTLPAWLAERAITVYHSTPTIFRNVTTGLAADSLPQELRLIVMGGEEVRVSDVTTFQRVAPEHCIFINGLGPTESTVTVQYFIDKHGTLPRAAVPIGRPVHDTDILLLDHRGEPTDFRGELAIRSPHVALGIWNRPDLTNQAFATDPHDPSRRIYRTGDMALQRPDGNLEFLGRRDAQVKIHGVRIETAEVEAVLLKASFIRECVVLARTRDDGEKVLAAFCVLASPASPRDIRAYLSERLPHAMIPTDFAVLDSLPLNHHGKLDTRKLLALETQDLSSRPPFSAPETDTERALATLWQDLLDVEAVGRDDHFFELGGNSLTASRSMAHIGKNLNLTVPLKIIIETPILKTLAETLDMIRWAGEAQPIPDDDKEREEVEL